MTSDINITLKSSIQRSPHSPRSRFPSLPRCLLRVVGALMPSQSFFSQPFSVQWRTGLVRLPRAVPSQIIRYTSPEGPQPFIVNVPSRGDYSIPVYVFVPANIDYSNTTTLPVMIDFHGGGFVLGSCLEQAPFCSKLARDLGGVVLSVDYRMGPIDKFPAAVEDAEDILSAVLDDAATGHRELTLAVNNKIYENGRKLAQQKISLDRTRIALAGFSSGGNLALNLVLSISPPLVGEPWSSRFSSGYSHAIPLLLYYPSFDSRQLPSERTRPPHLPVTGSFWDDVNDRLMPTYLPRDQAGHPRASPGLADIRNGLHPRAKMLLVLPEMDTLAEQSEIWVKKVTAAGREHDLVVERFPGMKHGWTQMPAGWLSAEEKRTRAEIFEKTIVFTRSVWARTG